MFGEADTSFYLINTSDGSLSKSLSFNFLRDISYGIRMGFNEDGKFL